MKAFLEGFVREDLSAARGNSARNTPPGMGNSKRKTRINAASARVKNRYSDSGSP